MKVSVKYILVVSTLLLTVSCWWTPIHTPQLVEADSLLMRGEYDAVDSLLATYDRTSFDVNEQARQYRSLLDIGRKFVDDRLTDADFSAVDSLCRYYDSYNMRNQQGKVLCFLGEVYYRSGDYPSALNAFLQTLEIAKACGDNYLQGWANQKLGDVYFSQFMLEECLDYYKTYQAISVSHCDTLRMALSTFRMGIVYTAYNKVDSAIYFYCRALRLAERTKHPDRIVPFCKYSLSDIYIQVEEFEKAKNLMSHDSLNVSNWAYWHLGQQHVDSAIWYFERMTEEHNLQKRADALRLLAHLEEQRGNLQKTLYYYNHLMTIEDSVRRQSLETESRKVQAQFNLNQVKREKELMAEEKQKLMYVLCILIVILMMGCIVGYFAWKYYRQRRNAEFLHERLLRREEERKHRLSIEKLAENKQRIADLEKLLAEVRDTETANRIQLDADILRVENKTIEVSQFHRDYLLTAFKKSPLYLRLQLHAGEDDFYLVKGDWQLIAQSVDSIFDSFTQRLLVLSPLSETELRACYLIKLGFPPSTIAAVLYKSKAAITMLRQRLYKKIAHRDGTAKQLDEFIVNF